ncbi:MAG: NHLP bacteriocin system secretion protein [Anaerolineae bacterium]|nr:NHLP bacteriocin system secretion protein [Anaerolineae bacterium]
MPSKPLFRTTALEQLSSPDQLDQLLQVTQPAGWIMLFACTLLLLAALAWGVFGSLSVEVSGQGVLLTPGGVRDVVALASGQLLEIDVAVGDTVTAGQVVARVDDAGQATDVVSPYTGRVLELKAVEGGLVERGTPLLSLEPTDADTLEAVVYIPAAEGGEIRPGMGVMIAPSTVRQEAYGFLLGEVSTVSTFPASRAGMLRVLGSAELVDALAAEGGVIEVRALLQRDPQTVSGYAWSSGHGPSLELHSGTLCTARVELSVQRPLSLLLPQLR